MKASGLSTWALASGGGETEGVGYVAVESNVLMTRFLINPGVSTH